MADEFDLKNLGLGEVNGQATGSVALTDLMIVVDPTTFEPRLETVTNVLAAS